MRYHSLFKMIAYRLIDIVTLGKGVPVRINGFKMKLPTKYFRLFPADYEKLNFDFFKRNMPQNSVVLDIGAHIGVYSVFFSKGFNAKVFSFEPVPNTLKWLCKTLDINNCNDLVSVIPSAISDKAGKARFFISKTYDVSAANSLVGYDEGVIDSRDGSYEVDMISIDEFVKERAIKPNVLKIDAEGVELQLLKGAAHTFLTYRPIATLGLHPFAYENKIEILEEIWNLLESYKMKVLINGELIQKDTFCYNEEFLFDVQLIPE